MLDLLPLYFTLCSDEMNLHSPFIYLDSLYSYVTLIESMRYFDYHVYVFVWDR
jgi:hypothetical protein